MNNKLKIIEELAKTCASDLGMEIISVDFVREFGMKILRVIASKPEMSIDDSADLNRKLGLKLDEVDLIDEEYYLEVSSEGIEKELKTDEDIKNAVGEYIFIRTKKKINGKKEFYGDLLNFTNQELVIKVNIKGKITEMKITTEQIERIRLAVRF
jgi:ribosome maturation factor RimP